MAKRETVADHATVSLLVAGELLRPYMPPA